jgi:hypothetical protein
MSIKMKIPRKEFEKIFFDIVSNLADEDEPFFENITYFSKRYDIPFKELADRFYIYTKSKGKKY